MKTPTVEKIYRTVQFEIKSIDREKRTFTAVASDSSLDRHGESINQDGWVLENYLKNPVVLYGHDYYAPPVAKTLEIGFNSDGQMVFTPQFADAETYDFADTIFRLYEGGYMRAFSVGFIPLDAEWDKVNEVFVYTKMELLEISAVTVPSNPNALALAYKEGVISEPERKKMIATHSNILKSLTEAKQNQNVDSNNEDEQMNKELLEAVTTLNETVKGLAESVATLKGEAVETDNLPEDEEATEEVVSDPDKPADENEAGGAEDEVVEETEMSPEDAQKIIDETVDKAMREARGEVE